MRADGMEIFLRFGQPVRYHLVARRWQGGCHGRQRSKTMTLGV
jgi:hypothetical protein